jgi:hypothetical protein
LGGWFVFRKFLAQEPVVKRLYDGIALLYFGLATVFVMLLALLLLGGLVAHAFADGEVLSVLESVGRVIIGFAIVETSRFIAEEEIVRRRELRSAVEARRSLTKFITIIVIAASLEALVMVLEASSTELERSIYPAAQFAAAMFALIALGVFQWLSSRIAAAPDTVGRATRRQAERSQVGWKRPAGERVKISTPVSVTPTECSNWAESERSLVTAVQSSSSTLVSGRPRLIMGSTVKNMPGSSIGPVPQRP